MAYRKFTLHSFKPQRFLKPLRFILIILITFSTVKSPAQITRTEPPFWFAGMKNPSLQILFYGKNITQFQPSAPLNVTITNVTRTENPNYLFVTIDTKNLPPGEINFSFTTSKKSFTSKYTLRPRRTDSATRKSFGPEDVIYLLMPDRFANGNTANDSSQQLTEKANRNNPVGRHGGDIDGIINNLDYIQSLGATALWSTPLCEDNDPAGSYHGYGQSDVYKIDPRYGTNDDYLRLSTELHKRKMKLILDYVTNHWGDHWTFKDMPTHDWLHQFPGYAQTNYRMTTQFDTHAATSDAELCEKGWFVKSMPDLNQANPLMLNYLIQNAIWWIEYADVDGFRVDTYSYNDKAGIAKWTKAITDEYPYFNIAGEVWMHSPSQISYWQKDSPVGAIESYNSFLPTVMDFPLHDVIGDVFNEDKAQFDKGIIRIYDNFANDFLYKNPNHMLVFLENHDTNRFNESYNGDLAKYKMGLALIATIRGIPQIYYGSEIGMRGSKATGDADIRRDFPGGWQNDPQNAFTAAGRTEIQQQFFDYTQKLLNWRKSKTVVHNGKMTHFVPEENVYIYFRHDDSNAVMVILNNSTSTQTIKAGRFSEVIQNRKTGHDVITGKTYAVDPNAALTIEPKSALILELD